MQKKKRTVEEQIEHLEISQKQNAARLAQLKARKAETDRKLDTRRKILMGAVLQKKAQNNPAIATQLIQWLNEGLTTARDRALFPGLSDLPPETPCQRNT